MPRRNQGPKLRYLKDRGAFYITWTINGRSRKRSTARQTASKLKRNSASGCSSENDETAEVIPLRSS